MAAGNAVQDAERRGLERRVEKLETDLRQLETQAAVIQATLNGLVSTMDSRHKAFERGQDLILKGIDQLEKGQATHESRITEIANAPQDLSRLVMSPGVILTIVATIIAIVSGQLASTWGMRSDIRDIGTRMLSQSTVDETKQKLLEERAAALKSAVDGVAKKQELQQLEVQSLREAVLNQSRRSP